MSLAILVAATLPVLGQAHGTTPAELSVKKMEVAPGLKVELFAAEPLLQNPVAFSIDEKGRFFIAETHRYKEAIFDITQKTNWLLNDLSFKTVADRAAFLAKTFQTNISVLTNQSETIRLVEDRDGDGRAETSSVFAENFRETVSGTAAGIMARDGEVWFTCIPDLWKFSAEKGTAKSREKLHTGYGIHIGVTGHDLHGLRIGPDGKIYFSSGDRGFSVKTKEGKILDYPNTGGVLRCNPDGSDLEVFCIGLRNPQDLVFDQFGNLWTDDNDTSGADDSRLLYLVEGADYGWRNCYQYKEGYGPWVQEDLWKGGVDGILPPAGVVAKGPAGLAFYPGTGLPEKYANHFFACDFPQGVWSFTVKSKGAGFELADKEHFLWHLGPTKIEFGPDSDVYVSDWGQAYPMPNAGKIYRVFDPTRKENAARAEVKKFLAEGMEKKWTNDSAKGLTSVRLEDEELDKLLGHSDMRVRLEAQFEIVRRGKLTNHLSNFSASTIFANIAKDKTQNHFARIHSLWGLRQISPNGGSDIIEALLKDPDAEIRAQAAKFMGGTEWFGFSFFLEPLLKDSSPRVRFFAAMSLGKLKSTNSIEPILQFLRDNDDKDLYLTHAGVFALTQIGDIEVIKKAVKDLSHAVRHAALLCLRRMGRSEIQEFLIVRGFNEKLDPQLAPEAARAINDIPIESGTEVLGAWLDQDDFLASIMPRSINVNFREGTLQNAVVVANLANRPGAPEEMRVLALDALGDWAKPGPLDRITGAWRPLPDRDVQPARDALAFVFENLLLSHSDKIVEATVRCARKTDYQEGEPLLFQLFQTRSTNSALRVEILETLDAFKSENLAEAVKAALKDKDHQLLGAAIKLLQKINPAEASSLLDNFLKTNADWHLGQSALTSLGNINGAANKIIVRELDNLLAGKLKPELQLELLEAAEKHKAPAVQEKLKQYRQSLSGNDALANYRFALAGGNAVTGKKIFHDREDVACLRCHAIKGSGGTVGPDLAGVASRHPKEYFLESILFPSKQIAAGFENITVTLQNGGSYAGLVKQETATELMLNSPEDGLVTIKKSDIAKRDRSLSAMPEGLGNLLSKRDLRDLIAYLLTLK